MTQKQLASQYEVRLHEQVLKLCHKLELKDHFNHYGPKVFTNYQRVALMVLFYRSGKALRKFARELVESRWPRWLGLRQLPSYRSLHEWACKFTLGFLRSLNTQFLSEEQPSLMAVDATGVDSWQRSRHYERRRNECRKQNGLLEEHMPYAKVDVFVDTETLLIHDHVLRVKPRHDVIGAATMFKRTPLEDLLALGDRGYDSESLHALARERGFEFYAPVRDFKVKRPGGRFRKQAWNDPPTQKSRRCLVESAIRSLKNKFKSLRSRLHFMKKRELAWIVLLHNLERASQRIKALLGLLIRAAF